MNSQAFTTHISLIRKFLAIRFTADTVDSELNALGRVLIVFWQGDEVEFFSRFSRQTVNGEEQFDNVGMMGGRFVDTSCRKRYLLKSFIDTNCIDDNVFELEFHNDVPWDDFFSQNADSELPRWWFGVIGIFWLKKIFLINFLVVYRVKCLAEINLALLILKMVN